MLLPMRNKRRRAPRKKSAIKEWREESEIESKVKLRAEIVFYGLPSH